MKKLLSLMFLVTITLTILSMAAMAKDEKAIKFPKPSPVTISAETRSDGSCQISWKRIEEENINYYNVYYMKVADDDRTNYKVSEILEKGTVKQGTSPFFFLSPTTAGQEGKYVFVVTVVSYGIPGQESAPSNVVTAIAKQNMHFSY